MSDTPATTTRVPVWGWAVRAGHWLLAGSVLTGLLLHEGGAWHEGLGYAALAVALARLAAGWLARAPQLRFSHFVRGWRTTVAYARALRHGREPRHLGHNPLGGWMVLALLGDVLLAGGSGALYATDAFWGDPVLSAIHQAAGWGLAVLAPLHVAGVLLTSRLQRENLVLAMLSGRKRAPAAGDVGLDR